MSGVIVKRGRGYPCGAWRCFTAAEFASIKECRGALGGGLQILGVAGEAVVYVPDLAASVGVAVAEPVVAPLKFVVAAASMRDLFS
jgi:hypothetical protein